MRVDRARHRQPQWLRQLKFQAAGIEYFKGGVENDAGFSLESAYAGPRTEVRGCRGNVVTPIAAVEPLLLRLVRVREMSEGSGRASRSRCGKPEAVPTNLSLSFGPWIFLEKRACGKDVGPGCGGTAVWRS